jgi:hypothetical protein
VYVTATLLVFKTVRGLVRVTSKLKRRSFNAIDQKGRDMNIGFLAAALLAIVGSGGFAPAAQAQSTTVRPAYGCFKVTAPQINIRATAFSTGAVLATASKNEILVKRRRFCTLRGYWCAVTTNAGIQGFADKNLIAVASCPARLSVGKG